MFETDPVARYVTILNSYNRYLKKHRLKLHKQTRYNLKFENTTGKMEDETKIRNNEFIT